MKVKDNEEQDTTGIRVFVYGTLKSGRGNWAWYLNNDRCTLLGRCAVTGPFTMYSLGFFPAVVEIADGEDSEIVGEVWLVDQETLDSLDLLEGHPGWYRRRKVVTPWKNAWMYTMPQSEVFSDDAIVESGCWDATEEETEWMNERTG